MIKLILAQGINYRFPNPTRIENLEDLISVASSLLQPIFILTFLAMLVYGGFLYLTAGDNDEKVASGRKTLIAAIIGFIITVLAPAVVQLISSLLGIEGLNLDT